MNKKQKKMLTRILIAAVMMVVLELLPTTGILRFVLYMIPYLVIGYDILRKAFRGILNRRIFDENFLMVVATLGAIAVGLAGTGDYTEAIAVMLFYQIGELFQSYAVGKSRKNISELMDIRPDYANVEQEGELVRVDPDEVAVGTEIIVQPGEKVPIDGIVVDGYSTLNTSALTGESLPREIVEGEEIISGCINMTRVLRVKTTKEFGESTVSKILELVENSTSHKSRSEAFITKFAKYYTPVVCYGALALALLPPLARMLFFGLPADWGTWVYRALTFLVISCPCALVISIPLSFFAGIGGASNAGILIKGSNYLETLAKTKLVVFDKTGTLTKGVFEVNGIHHSELENQKLLEYAALAESASSHPISKSIRRAYGQELDHSRVRDIEEISGSGVTAVVDGMFVAAGNDKLMKKLNVPYIECRSIGTIVHMAIDGKYAGHIVISDIEKPHAVEAVAELRKTGIERTVMLTGDKQRVAEQVAEHLGIDQVFSEMLPVDKVNKDRRNAGEEAGESKTCVCRRRDQRRAGAPPGRYRYRNGGDGIGRGDRGGGYRIDGRRAFEDRESDPYFQKMSSHRTRKYRVRTWGKDPLSDPRCIRHRKYVACDLCRRGRDDPGSFECDPRIVCEKIINLALPKANTWVLKVFTLDI